ncbi:hypothetical protein AYK20_00495 [Thermoplasmatales archaeon SG8-52-1]|nr:MAG: hypothetical protein AYK20_00495 [Thermoplasmatales archaeon SG8-52-1]
MECPVCKGKMIIKKTPYSYKGIYFGIFEAYCCDSCKESFIREKHLQAIEDFAKEMGVWGPGIIPHYDRSSSDHSNQLLVNFYQISNRVETKPYKVMSVK